MGKRFAIVIGAAALGAAVIAAGASADFRSVNDPRGDARCERDFDSHKPCSDSKRTRRLRRNADIVRATAGHDGTRLKHTIRVVGKFRSVYLLINTDSDPDCEWSLWVTRRGPRPAGYCGVADNDHPARVDVHFHSVEVSFSTSSIGNPASYGWSAVTQLGDRRAATFDHVPNGRTPFHYIEHSLG